MSVIQETLGVQDLLRIPNQEYPVETMIGQCVWHVNLPLTYTRSDMLVALPRIIQSGRFCPPDEEQLPVLSYQSIWRAKVIDFLFHVQHEMIPAKVFSDPMIGGARNRKELQELVVRRYQPVLPFENTQGILEKGVSLTYLRLEELVSLAI